MQHPMISSDRVEGTTVYNPAGEKLGKIDCVMIDKRSGQARYAVMEFGGFLGIGADHYPVPWSLLTYDTQLDGYVIPLDQKVLEDAPHHDRYARPTYTEEYGQRVRDHYGVIGS